MSKVALLFPGQGAQYVGMCKDIWDKTTLTKELFQKAQDTLDFDLKSMIFDAKEDVISQTQYTQALILIHSIVLFRQIQDFMNLKFDAAIGLSLGEYSALVASGKLDFKEAVSLVRKRGIFMQEVANKHDGSMAAILGLNEEAVLELINEAKENEVLEIANYNCPGQIVISGHKNAIKRAISLAKNFKAKKAVELSVSGPFHSSLLKEAGEKLSQELKNINFKYSDIKVLTNIDAKTIENRNIVEILKKQVSSSVHWQESIENLIEDGFDTFIEIGPSKTLSAFVKKISKNKSMNCKIFNVDYFEDIKNLKDKIFA